MITIDRLNKSVVAVRDLKRNSVRHPRKLWYNKKTLRGAKKIKTLINFMYYEKTEQQDLFFITVTTCQHKSGISDYECNRRIGLWLKNRGVEYVCVLERQHNTEDIHYHIILLDDKRARFDIGDEIRKLARLFEVEPHPALFDVKRIKSITRIVGYIRKYVTKDNGKYSSIYRCRTYTVSRKLGARYKQNINKYVVKFGSSTSFVSGRDYLAEFLSVNKLVEQFSTDFFKVYEYSDYIWQRALELRDEHLTYVELYHDAYLRSLEENATASVPDGERPL